MRRLALGAPRGLTALRPAALVAATVLLVALAGCADGGEDPHEATTGTAGAGGPALVEASLPKEAQAAKVAVAGGHGWLTLADQEALWRMTPGGETARVPAFDGFEVRSLAAFGEDLVVAGIRCERELVDGSCEGRPQIHAIGPRGRSVWSLELPPLAPGTALAGVSLGSTEAVTWLFGTSGPLAIDRSGEVVERLAVPTGELCLLDGDLYALANQSLIDADEGPAADPDVPPTTVAEPGVEQSEELVVQRLEGETWSTIEGSRTVVEGQLPVGRCANGGFETSGGRDGLPTARWTPAEERWTALDPPTEPDPLLGVPARTTGGVEYVVVPETGEVLRRVADEVAYAPVGLALENEGLGQSGALLTVGEDGRDVFACVSPEQAVSCGFGQRAP